MLLIKFGQPHDVEKAVALLRQLAPFVLRSGSGGRSQKAVQALVSLLKERGESEEAEDWQQWLAEGRLSAVPGLRKARIYQALLQTKLLSRRLLD